MATTTKKVLALKFGFTNDADATTTVNINNASDSLTDEQIKAAMDRVVAAGALSKKDKTTGCDKVVEANYISTITEEIAL